MVPEGDGTDRELLDLALRVAREAGALALRMRHEGVEVAATKSSDTDVVTRADRASEELLRERILAARPDDAIVGEEGDDVRGGSGVRWVLDPVDGTVNYLYGLPHWAVSVAAARTVDGVEQVVAGAVVAPVLGREYAALHGAGSWRDGVRLQVREPAAPEAALVATGFSYSRDVRTRQGRAVAELLARVRDVRRGGSCALDLCALAEGAVDAYVEEGPYWWDHAAAGLVATEAGAVVDVSAGPELDLVVAAPAAAYDGFERLVRECGFRG
ncbi:inositol monophosphatase family protein [Nocardioides aurantiacus]|uniref:inositol monophosphatase family protein n=1 Tax=Nocardioides aurantiacus TaxID=86796 RepID=UPI000F47F6C3|nr:inositol monophosphatase family protein [Nocardioides aurantiacus]